MGFLKRSGLKFGIQKINKEVAPNCMRRSGDVVTVISDAK